MKQQTMIKSKIVNNAGWIIASRVVQSVLALIISMLTARFLGPSNYGLISYAESIVAFFVPIMNLGLSHVLVQELTNHPDEEGKIIGTSIILSILSSFACIGGVIAFTLIVDTNKTTNIVVVLYSLMLIAQAFELIQYWYQQKLLSKYTAIIALFSYILVSCYKIVLLVFKSGVFLFAISNSIDYLLIAFSLLFLYKKLGGQKISFSSPIGKRMVKKSRHYIVSSMMVTIFAQTDRVMLKIMINEEAVGFYSAAVKCAGFAGFIFSAIIDSFRPIIFQHKKNNNAFEYENDLKRLYSIVIFLALLQSALMTIFAKFFIFVLYGDQYEASIIALQIIVWYTTFSYIGAVRNIWILGENKQKYLWILNLGGALMNILLNLALIPNFGIYGAALASLLTQFFTNVIMNIIVWPLRYNNVLIVQSLNPKIIVDLFKKDNLL